MDNTIQARLGFLIGDVTRLYRREFDRRSAQLGLTRGQWRALRRIARFEGRTQVELAADLELAPIAVGRVLDRLEKAGFIERRPDPKDRRCWRLYLAAGSAKVMQGVDAIAEQLIGEIFAGIAGRDLEIAERVLTCLKHHLMATDRDGAGVATASDDEA